MSRFNTGNPLGSGSPLDLDDNAKNMDLAANSDGDTFQDRMGKSRLTWAGIEKAGSGDPAIAVDAASRAVAAAQSVEENAEQIAQDAAQQAVDNVVIAVDGAVGRAEGAADRAEAASNAAFINADIYPDVASGLAAVADGEQFQVLSADGLEYLRYRKDGETVATEVGVGFPSSRKLEFISQEEAEDWAMGFADDSGRAALGLRKDGVTVAAAVDLKRNVEMRDEYRTGVSLSVEDGAGNSAIVVLEDGTTQIKRAMVDSLVGLKSINGVPFEDIGSGATVAGGATAGDAIQFADGGRTYLSPKINKTGFLFSPEDFGGGYAYSFAPSLTRIGKNKYIVAAEGRVDIDDTARISTACRVVEVDPDTLEPTIGPVTMLAEWFVDPEDPSSYFSYMNPCTARVDSGVNQGRIYVYLTRVNGQRTKWRLFERHSDDEGGTWSQLRDISTQFGQSDTADPESFHGVCVGPGHAIQLRNGPFAGRLILPCYHRGLLNLTGDNPASEVRSFIAFSDDGGETYEVGEVGMPDGSASNECLAAEDYRGDVVLLVRRNGSVDKWVARSRDGGQSFYTYYRAPGLEWGNEVQSGFLQAANVFDYASPKLIVTTPYRGPGVIGRRNLYAFTSYDGGHTFPLAYQVNNISASYSDIAGISPDAFLMVCATNNTGSSENITQFIKWTIVSLNNIIGA